MPCTYVVLPSSRTSRLSCLCLYVCSPHFFQTPHRQHLYLYSPTISDSGEVNLQYNCLLEQKVRSSHATYQQHQYLSLPPVIAPSLSLLSGREAIPRRPASLSNGLPLRQTSLVQAPPAKKSLCVITPKSNLSAVIVATQSGHGVPITRRHIGGVHLLW